MDSASSCGDPVESIDVPGLEEAEDTQSNAEEAHEGITNQSSHAVEIGSTESNGEHEDSDAEAMDVQDDAPPNPRRYFNQQLRAVYESVQFPVRQPFPTTPATVPSTEYTRALHRNGTTRNASKRTPRVRWCHSVRTPTHPPPDPLYGNRFRALVNMPNGDDGSGGGDGGSGPSNKRQKKAKDSNHEASGSKDPKQPPKARKQQQPSKPKASTKSSTDLPAPEKKATFKRKNAVQGVLRTYKIRMWPNEAQTKELKRLFAASRCVKNWCNAELKRRRRVPDERSPGTFKQLYPTRIGIRNHFKAKGRHRLPSWASENMSSTVFDNACFDVSKAWTNGIDAVKAGRITHFDVKFWSSTTKTPTEVVKVDKKDRPCGTAGSSIFDTTTRHTPAKRRSAKHSECLLHLNKGFAKLGGIRMQDKTPIIERLLSEGRMLKEDCKIKWDKRARSFHFIYTVDMPVTDDPNPDWSTKRVTAFDGGIRGFQTFCNATTGQYGELVCGFDRRIHDRVERIDNLHSRCVRKQQGRGVRTSDKQRKPRAQRRHDRINARERRRRQGKCCPSRKPAKDKRLTRLNRKLRRERVRQTNWVEAVHYNAINFVFATTDVVINPVLRTGSMAPRNGRVFGSDSCRAMLTMSHYKFNWRLQSAASRFPGRHVIDDTGEPGTSRTCANPNCGRWHVNLGGDHVFTCPHCGISLNRDDNGARGNLLAAYGKAVGVLADATSNQ